MEEQHQPHFLVVTYPTPGHVNPALHLVKRLAASTSAAITFSTAVNAHRRMFPSVTGDEEISDGVVTFIPYSDGFDDGFMSSLDSYDDLRPRIRLSGMKTLAAIIERLAARGQPVTCVIYTLIEPWAADVARDHGIPSVFCWIQPATVFASYYHYFHGHESLIAAHRDEPMFTVDLPGLPPLRIRDLPSFLTITDSDDPQLKILAMFKEMFDTLDQEPVAGSKPRVLVNTFDELEAAAISAVDEVGMIAIGPLVPSRLPINEEEDSKAATTPSCGDLFKPDNKGYMEWLDSKPEKSVVYVSFGSLSKLKKRQLEEIFLGLKESGRPYLWVVRKDNREEEGVEFGEGENDGMVVEWCNQVRVLSHPSVACFVTHCGWNSTIESLVCGVPTIGVPQWTDQGMNSRHDGGMGDGS